MAQAPPQKHVAINEEATETITVPANEEKAVVDAPTSPGTPGKVRPVSPGRNVKAEAFAEAHSKRVETEAQAFLESEIRKTEAHAQKLSAKVEKDRMGTEHKALEVKKKEDQRADGIVHAAELKAEKIVSQAKEKSLLVKAHAQEEAEKTIADANTKAERAKAEIEESKQRQIAELRDKAEQMIAVGELPPEHKEGKLKSAKR